MPRLAAENQPTILRQVADVAITIRDEQVEIALSPEELGRIRMVLSGREHAPHLVVWAERPEVLDQLRRNAATLLQNFGETGLQDATFEFREGGFEGRDVQPDWMAPQAPAVEVEIPEHLAQHAITSGGWTALGAHIDMRM
nr:flagellar hook-length control protein FliK [Paracoccus amoyensis]